ncbi:MAG: nucleotidyltransferase family protein [Tissierellia bacterium]|nr:nucleotidyltransferase family protein [Tissierellia bacterium]
MKIVGIVAEYNPFHNGHKYQIDYIKEHYKPDGIVAIISGSFSQRGEPTIVDKFARADMAIRSGVDLVLELPFIYSCQNAEIFASGAIKILNDFGPISHISFGAEDENMENLINIAKSIISPNVYYDEILKKHINDGLSYIISNERALLESETLNLAQVNTMKKPNNILAIEYIKTILKNDYSMDILPVKRHLATHSTVHVINDFTSSTKLRNMIYKSEPIERLVPKSTDKNLIDASLPNMATLKALIDYNLVEDIKNTNSILDNEHGLINRCKNLFINSNDYQSGIELVSSKRITKSRVRRFLTNYIVYDNDTDFIRNSLKFSNSYIRILGMNQIGRQIIRLSNNENIITKFKDYEKLDDNIGKIADIEVKANNIRSLLCNEVINSDYLKSPIIL